MNRPILILQLFYSSALFAISLANPLPKFGAINNASLFKCGVAEPQGHYGFFPWMAFVDESIYGSCTGTIVGANWILTAGHCAVDEEGNTIDSANFHVYVGDRNFEEGQQIGVADVFPHPDFYNREDEFSVENDISLLKLETPIKFDGIKLAPVCLGGKFEWGQKGTIAGWGNQNFPIADDGQCEYDPNINIPIDMLVGEETLIKPEDCLDADGTHYFDSPTTKICTKPLNAETESGDSGGPLMVQDLAGQWRQIGIISYGHCHFPKRDRYDPDIFTAVGPYCDWIKETTNGEVQCGI